MATKRKSRPKGLSLAVKVFIIIVILLAAAVALSGIPQAAQFFAAPIQPQPIPGPEPIGFCGDGVCTAGENRFNCPEDCSICGDGVVEGPEQCEPPGGRPSIYCQSGFTCDQNCQCIQQIASKVDVVNAYCNDNSCQNLILRLQNTGNTAVPLNNAGTFPTTTWILKDENQNAICSTLWASPYDVRCIKNCGDNVFIDPGEIKDITLEIEDQGECSELFASGTAGKVFHFTIDFSGKTTASGSFIKPGAGGALPDAVVSQIGLTHSTITVPPNSNSKGQNAPYVGFDFCNLWAGPTPPQIDLVHASVKETLPNGQVQSYGEFGVDSTKKGYCLPSVTGGGHVPLAQRITVGADVAGTHRLTVCTDSRNQVAESNENNNCESARFTVTVSGGGALPDLVLTNVAPWSPSRGFGPPKVGDNIGYSYQIYNIGQATGSGDYRVQAWINGRELRWEGGFQIPPPGEIISPPPQYSFDTYQTSGKYTLKLQIDSLNQIVESNEVNNVIEVTYYVT